jgi:hypothetical protein
MGTFSNMCERRFAARAQAELLECGVHGRDIRYLWIAAAEEKRLGAPVFELEEEDTACPLAIPAGTPRLLVVRFD